MRGPIRVASLALAVLGLVGACSLLPGSDGPSRIVDTWPIGERLACTPDDRCPELLQAGLDGIEDRDGPLPILEATLHREGARTDPVTGQQILSTRSGGPIHVLLVHLADGSERAIGVGFPGISREPVVMDREATP